MRGDLEAWPRVALLATLLVPSCTWCCVPDPREWRLWRRRLGPCISIRSVAIKSGSKSLMAFIRKTMPRRVRRHPGPTRISNGADLGRFREAVKRREALRMRFGLAGKRPSRPVWSCQALRLPFLSASAAQQLRAFAPRRERRERIGGSIPNKLCVDDVVADGVSHEVAKRVELQLAHDRGPVRLDGLHANSQRDGNLLVSLTLGE